MHSDANWNVLGPRKTHFRAWICDEKFYEASENVDKYLISLAWHRWHIYINKFATLLSRVILPSINSRRAGCSVTGAVPSAVFALNGQYKVLVSLFYPTLVSSAPTSFTPKMYGLDGRKMIREIWHSRRNCRHYRLHVIFLYYMITTFILLVALLRSSIATLLGCTFD